MDYYVPVQQSFKFLSQKHFQVEIKVHPSPFHKLQKSVYGLFIVLDDGGCFEVSLVGLYQDKRANYPHADDTGAPAQPPPSAEQVSLPQRHALLEH